MASLSSSSRRMLQLLMALLSCSALLTAASAQRLSDSVADDSNPAADVEEWIVVFKTGTRGLAAATSRVHSEATTRMTARAAAPGATARTAAVAGSVFKVRAVSRLEVGEDGAPLPGASSLIQVSGDQATKDQILADIMAHPDVEDVVPNVGYDIPEPLDPGIPHKARE